LQLTVPHEATFFDYHLECEESKEKEKERKKKEAR
jgi:hypothetical protein